MSRRRSPDPDYPAQSGESAIRSRCRSILIESAAFATCPAPIRRARRRGTSAAAVGPTPPALPARAAGTIRPESVACRSDGRAQRSRRGARGTALPFTLAGRPRRRIGDRGAEPIPDTDERSDAAMIAPRRVSGRADAPREADAGAARGSGPASSPRPDRRPLGARCRAPLQRQPGGVPAAASTRSRGRLAPCRGGAAQTSER